MTLPQLLILSLLLAGSARGQTFTNLAGQPIFRLTNDWQFIIYYDEEKHTVDLGKWLSLRTDETNAVAVCLVTNTVEADNSYRWKTGDPPVFIYGGENWRTAPDRPATERYVTTTITERKTLSLVWDGKPETITREREVSRTVKTFRKSDEWKEIETPQPVAYFTNWGNILTNLFRQGWGTNWVGR